MSGTGTSWTELQVNWWQALPFWKYQNWKLPGLRADQAFASYLNNVQESSVGWEFLVLSKNFGIAQRGSAKDTHGPCHLTAWNQPKWPSETPLCLQGRVSHIPGANQVHLSETFPGCVWSRVWYFLVLELWGRISSYHLPVWFSCLHPHFYQTCWVSTGNNGGSSLWKTALWVSAQAARHSPKEDLTC